MYGVYAKTYVKIRKKQGHNHGVYAKTYVQICTNRGAIMESTQNVCENTQKQGRNHGVYALVTTPCGLVTTLCGAVKRMFPTCHYLHIVRLVILPAQTVPSVCSHVVFSVPLSGLQSTHRRRCTVVRSRHVPVSLSVCSCLARGFIDPAPRNRKAWSGPHPRRHLLQVQRS